MSQRARKIGEQGKAVMELNRKQAVGAAEETDPTRPEHPLDLLQQAMPVRDVLVDLSA
jgi:hypothetical protein